eukprot:7694798-Heterocapsa_arctica.AAC.1
MARTKDGAETLGEVSQHISQPNEEDGEQSDPGHVTAVETPPEVVNPVGTEGLDWGVEEVRRTNS